MKSVRKILNREDIPILFNGDPRGYTLKINSGTVRSKNLNIAQDMGGYGLIAPDLR